jgi:Glyoxalase-like domain
MPVRLLLQQRQRAGAQDRVSGHIDFACADPRWLAERHVAAGAQILTTFPFWVVMADPAGRRCCLTMRDPETGKLAATGRA